MKVFISWSGDLSRAVAVELRWWLGLVVQHVDAWMSKRDIDPGNRWILALSQELRDSDFVIICLTKENKESPWIHFEAGAVARSEKARVIPLLIELTPKDLDGAPLSQYQSLSCDEDGIKDLVYTLYKESGSPLNINDRDVVFSRMWPLIQDRIKGIKDQKNNNNPIESPIDVIDEATEVAQPNLADINRILDNIEIERQRLAAELDYFNVEEEKLMQQDAPISISERYIQPVQSQLTQIDITLSTILDKIFFTLTTSQISLLQSLMKDNLRKFVPIHSLYLQKADLEILLKSGLIDKDKNGIVFIQHDLVAKYVSKKYSG